MTTIDLSGTWEFKAVDSDGTLPTKHSRTREWMPATVPGTVHTDLMAQQIIPDPFYRTNETDVQWVEKEQWVQAYFQCADFHHAGERGTALGRRSGYVCAHRDQREAGR